MASIDLFPGQWQPQVVLMAALEVGLIAPFLDRPRSPAEVVETLALDPHAAQRAISVLVDAGCLEERGDRLIVANDIRPLLNRSDDAFVGDRLLHVHALLSRWVQLPDILRHGGPAQLERTPESLRTFIGAMRAGALKRARPLADLLATLYPATKTVLDVGGGPGTQALAFQSHGWQVTVLDYPDVIEFMGNELAESGIAAIGADATQGIPTQGFDLVFCGNLFHSMAPADCAAVVKSATDALAPRGALAIFDFLRGTGLRSSLFAVNMLAATESGDVYAEDDYRGWCEAAGLRGFAVQEVPGHSQRLLTASKR